MIRETDSDSVLSPVDLLFLHYRLVSIHKICSVTKITSPVHREVLFIVHSFKLLNVTDKRPEFIGMEHGKHGKRRDHTG